MRKGMWSAAAAFVVLLSGAGVVLGIPRGLAAESRVAMVEGSQSDYTTWKFDPVEVTVPVGTTVVWHNDGKIEHTATAENNSFDSGTLKPGGSFSFTFSAPGDVKYVCTPHKDLGMKGVVHVVGGSTATTAATTATTQPAGTPTSATTATTAPHGQASTTTTAAPGASTTTTTAAGAATSTTAAPVSAAPASAAPATATATESTTTTTVAPKVEEGAEGGHKRTNQGKSSPVGIAFAAVSTLLLTAIAAKLLASKP